MGRYGVYSRSKNKESQKIINLWRFMVHKEKEVTFPPKEMRKKTYRERMLESYERDPIACPCCKQTILLAVIWHADYGRIYYDDEDSQRAYQKKWDIRTNERKKKQGTG